MTDRWAEGWDLYERRLDKTSVVTIDNMFGPIAHKIWCGQRDCRVIFAQEQGIGDNIMFARFLPQLESEYGIKASLQVNPSLGVLLSLNGIDCPIDIDISAYDYVLPLGSVCRFARYVDSLPYIKHSSSLSLGSELNIGVVWSGSSTHVNDRHRSCPVGYFKELTKFGKLWNLNPSVKSRDLPSWVSPLEISTWTDTAAALNALDLVVTVDTSVAHLAGAMGVPCYMLQPRKETDFRHGSPVKAYRGNNIWYESLTVVPNPSDWSKCMDNLNKALIE